MWIIYLFSGYLIVQILMSKFSVYVVYLCYLLKCGMWDIILDQQVTTGDFICLFPKLLKSC